MDKPAEIIKALTMEIERLKEMVKYKSMNSMRTIKQLVKMNPELIENQVTDLTEYLHMWPLFRKIGWLYETSIGLDITSTDWMALSS